MRRSSSSSSGVASSLIRTASEARRAEAARRLTEEQLRATSCELERAHTEVEELREQLRASSAQTSSSGGRAGGGALAECGLCFAEFSAREGVECTGDPALHAAASGASSSFICYECMLGQISSALKEDTAGGGRSPCCCSLL